MALTQTLEQIRTNVRNFADIAGTSALARHPDLTINDYINRALASLYRILTGALPDQRYLSSSTITTVAGTSLYNLPADFNHLISLDLTANGTKVWLEAYEMHERALLTDPASTYTGIPYTYRLRGSSAGGTQIELLPTATAVYTGTLWYVPDPSQMSTDASTFDTISRLDEYLIAYAARIVFVRDKKPDMVAVCKDMIEELRRDVQTIARSRDKNSPSRPVDETLANRWGRRVPAPRRWQ